MRNWRIRVLQALTIIFFIVLCEFVVQRGIISDLYLAAPSNVIVTLYELIISGELTGHFLTTVLEFTIGFGAAILLGVGLGFAMGLSKPLEGYFTPLLSALMAVPTVTIIPLLILWLGMGLLNKIVVVFLFTFFLIVFNTITGVKATLPNHIKVARVFEASRAQLITKVIIPSAAPSIFAGLRVAAATGLVGVLFAEMLASREGLGYLLNMATQFYDTGQLFAIILVVTALSVLIIELINLIERIFFTKWKSL
ncbi:ABC transporter permease [Oceanobacillus jeddahense]|uniref:ABC transporter permease n=1 Tax=Oceanobacillus jeddahense TaxID=1462527 RepID=A0ABY5JWK3_9BACI|nr:ABC transporter permease [Oceanobacillus jeddahense]UUI04760.1 ABC transporter permease [Oceanobacillus jeddahense]